jgi:hypothetical protein
MVKLLAFSATTITLISFFLVRPSVDMMATAPNYYDNYMFTYEDYKVDFEDTIAYGSLTYRDIFGGDDFGGDNNLIENGDFSNGTTGWVVNDLDNINTTNGFYGETNLVGDRIYSPYYTSDIGNKIYLYVGYISISGSSQYTSLIRRGSTKQLYSLGYAPSTYNDLSLIYTNDVTSGNIIFYPHTVSSTTGTVSLKDVMLYDLTSIFGAGNEPTLAEFDELLENWNTKQGTIVTQAPDVDYSSPTYKAYIDTIGNNGLEVIQTTQSILTTLGDTVEYIVDLYQRVGNVFERTEISLPFLGD